MKTMLCSLRLFVLFVALVFIVSTSCFASPLRVVSEHLPPHQIAANGKLVDGISYHIMREVFNHTSHDVEMEALPWARAYRVAKEQGNTIIFNIARTANREKQFKWIGKITEVLFSNLFRCDLNFSVVVLLILITLLSPHCTL